MSPRSWPAEKQRPAPRTTTTAAPPRSEARLLTCSSSASNTGTFSELSLSGRLRTRCTALPRASRRTRSLTRILLFQESGPAATPSPRRPLVPLRLLEHVDGAGGAHAHHVGEAEPRALDLAGAGFAAQVRGDLVDVGDAGGAQRVALGEQAAGYVHGDAPAERRVAGVDQLAGFALGAKAEVLVVHDLSGRKAIVQLDQVDVLRPDAGHLVGGLRRHAGHGVEVRHHRVARRVRIAGHRRGAHPNGAAHQAKALGGR